MIKRYLNQKLLTKEQGVEDEYSFAPVAIKTKVIKCRLDEVNKEIDIAQGQRVLVKYRIQVSKREKLKAGDKVVINGAEYVIQSVTEIYGLSNKVAFKEIMV